MENKLSPKELATRVKLYDSGGDVRKRWFVEYYAFNPISSEYQRIRFYKGINDHRNISDRYEVAKKALAKIKRKIKAGWSPFVEREKKALLRRKKKRELSIAEHLEMVFQANIPNLKSKSISDYRVILKSFSSWMSKRGLDDLQILAFSKQLAREYMEYLGQERKLHPTTRNAHLTLLKTWFEELVHRELISQNPFKSIRKLRTAKTSLKYFKRPQEVQLKNYIKPRDAQLYLFVEFLSLTYLRPHRELRLLKVGDVDIYSQTIHIPAEISKNNKNQSIVLPESLLNLLMEINISDYPEHFYIFGKENKPSEKPRHKAYFYRAHKKYLDELAFGEGYSLYSWKHTGIVKAVKKKIGPKYVQMQARHHSLDETDKYMRRLVADDNSPFRDL